jgi:hypothetical protein
VQDVRLDFPIRTSRQLHRLASEILLLARVVVATRTRARDEIYFGKSDRVRTSGNHRIFIPSCPADQIRIERLARMFLIRLDTFIDDAQQRLRGRGIALNDP